MQVMSIGINKAKMFLNSSSRDMVSLLSSLSQFDVVKDGILMQPVDCRCKNFVLDNK